MSSSQQKVHTGAQSEQQWNFDIPPSGLKGAKMQLLTIGGISVTGTWLGNLGQYYVAWAPLLKIPKPFPKVANG